MHKTHKTRTLFLFLTVLVVFSLIATPATQAQEVAVGQATATVLAALAVVASQALAFGATVLQGVEVIVGPGDAACGHFTITGATTSEISINLQLPDYLWLGAAGGEDRMVIAFGATDVIIDPDAAGIPGTPTINALAAENPYAIGDIAPMTTVVNVFLGGKIYPAVDQRVGAYAADIVCTVAYTGA